MYLRFILFIFSSQDEVTKEPKEAINSEASASAKTKKKTARFIWTTKMQESLLASLMDIKTQYEFNGLDFEADLPRMYGEVRVKMAKIYSEFGPIEVQRIKEDVAPEDLASLKAKADEEKKSVKKGYERTKQKIRDIRQDYRKAVTEGRRSGSGKVVCDNWDTLKVIWGGSPATTTIRNSVNSLNLEESEDIMVDDLNDDMYRETLDLPNTNNGVDDEQMQDNAEDNESDNGTESEDDDNNEEQQDNKEQGKKSEVQQEQSKEKPIQNNSKNEEKQKPKNQFVDNKRKLLEKQLSANQRDQLYLKIAKDEYIMKEKMVNALSEATKESNKAFSDISKSIEKVGTSIESGLTALAQAIGGMNQQRPQPTFDYDQHPTFHHPPNYVAQNGAYSVKSSPGYPSHNNGVFQTPPSNSYSSSPASSGSRSYENL